MKPAFVFDGRNALDHEALRALGFVVYALGKPLDPFVTQRFGEEEHEALHQHLSALQLEQEQQHRRSHVHDGRMEGREGEQEGRAAGQGGEEGKGEVEGRREQLASMSHLVLKAQTEVHGTEVAAERVAEEREVAARAERVAEAGLQAG